MKDAVDFTIMLRMNHLTHTIISLTQTLRQKTMFSFCHRQTASFTSGTDEQTLIITCSHDFFDTSQKQRTHDCCVSNNPMGFMTINGLVTQ